MKKLLLPLLLLFLAQNLSALDGREIMEKVDQRDKGNNVVTDMEMTLTSKNGDVRERNLSSFRKDSTAGEMSLMFFLKPADVRNTGFLTIDYDNSEQDDDQFIYMPALRKTKRIAGADKAGSFMGSDLNYSDLAGLEIEDYEFKLLQEDTLDGHKTWVVLSTPKSEKIMEETGYSKRVAWVRQDNFLVVQAKAWIYNSKEVKFLRFLKPVDVEGIWFITESHVVRKLGNTTMHETLLKYSNIRINQKLDDGMFTERGLEKGL